MADLLIGSANYPRLSETLLLICFGSDSSSDLGARFDKACFDLSCHSFMEYN